MTNSLIRRSSKDYQGKPPTVIIPASKVDESKPFFMDYENSNAQQKQVAYDAEEERMSLSLPQVELYDSPKRAQSNASSDTGPEIIVRTTELERTEVVQVQDRNEIIE